MLTVEPWPLARLIPYARNPRKNDAAVDRMCAAIREFGFRIPVVARSDGTVIDGHLRLKAAQRLGLADVPVALADDLSEAQIKAFRLLANRSAAWAEWDDELLALELQDLQGLGYDLALTGFDAGELKSLMDGPATGLTDEDAIPVPPAEPVTRPVICGFLGPIGCSAATPLSPPISSACWPGQRRICWSAIRLMASTTILPGGMTPGFRQRNAPARSPMTTAPTGGTPGRCFPATSPTSGMPRSTPPRWPKA
jgi:ParB-like nuclease domain